jgi:triacylglycerol lipase
MPIPNDFDTPGFSITTAYYLVNACQASYLNELGDWIAELALGKQAATFQFGAMHGFVADMPGATVLAFRGTDNIENWLTDGRAVQVTDPAYAGKVHRGFATALAEMWADLKARLPPAGTGRPLWVTGHSLGAALATLASVRLLNEGYAVKGVYTFGCPRVGNLVFYDAYKPEQFRFVNNNDLVPHVPLETLLVGVPGSGILHFVYKHVGTLKYMNRQGRLGEGMSNWNAKKEFLLGALVRSGGTQEPDAIADHHIGNYVKAVAVNLP